MAEGPTVSGEWLQARRDDPRVRIVEIWFAMTQIVGWNHVRVYDGSWTEWGSIVGFPVGI